MNEDFYGPVKKWTALAVPMLHSDWFTLRNEQGVKMCKHIITVAEITTKRFITVCEHQTVRVQWDHLALSWQADAYRRFVKMVQHQMRQQTIPEPTVMIQVGETLVGWPTDEFYQFVDLALIGFFNLDRALEQLSRQTTPPRLAKRSAACFCPN